MSGGLKIYAAKASVRLSKTAEAESLVRALPKSRSRISCESFAEKHKPNLLRELYRNAEAESLVSALPTSISRISCESFDEKHKPNLLRELCRKAEAESLARALPKSRS